MALTRNYDRMGMWSPKAIARCKQKENKAAKQIAWVKDFMAKGGDYRKAAVAYRVHLEAVARVRRESYRRMKQAQHQQRLSKSKAKKQARSVVHASVPQAPRPVTHPHYRPGMSSSDFYRCWEWQTLRYEVIREFGATCMCCGAAGNHVDHIKARSKFPALELARDNLQILCEACNRGKSNLYEDDWRPRGLTPGPA